jgi:ubiquinone/menaquinone biosynthesis C-methylase UbiE
MTIDPEEHERSALAGRLPRVDPCHVLEIGCGDGRLTRRYSALVSSVLAIDSDESSIAAFRTAGVDPNVEVRATPLMQLELRDASLDCVVFSWAL